MSKRGRVFNNLLLTPKERERYVAQLCEFEEQRLPDLQRKLNGLSPGDQDAFDDVIEVESFVRGAIDTIKQALRQAGTISVQEATTADYVRLGSRVMTRHENGDKRIYAIGLTLYDLPRPTPDMGGITWQSPIAKALLGKRKDDKALVNAPCGKYVLHVLSVHQQNPAN